MNEQAGNTTTESSALDGDAENLNASFQAGRDREAVKRGKPAKKDKHPLAVFVRGMTSSQALRPETALVTAAAAVEQAYVQTGKNYYSKLLSEAAKNLESSISQSITENAGRPTLELMFDIRIQQKGTVKRYVPSVQELMDTDGMAEFQRALGKAQKALLAKGINLEMKIDQAQASSMSKGVGLSGRSSVIWLLGKMTPAPEVAK